MADRSPAHSTELLKTLKEDSQAQANIHRVRSGKRIAKPSVIAEVGRENGRWVFLDFSSADRRGLLAALKSLRADREKASK